MISIVRRPTAVLLAVLLLVQSCAPAIRHRLELPEEVATTPDLKSPFLNAHMRDGQFITLTDWSVDESGAVVRGEGRRLDADRRILFTGAIEFPVDSVVVFEAAGTSHMSPAMRAITIVLVGTALLAAIVLVAIAIACAADPKCFGSCPTFYADDGGRAALQAEGFSASVAPSLEATDIDALYRVRPRDRALEITMKNEALETHVVRSVRVLAASRPRDRRVFATSDGVFWRATRPAAARRAAGPEGDCLDALSRFDGIERTSTVDSTDLAARETVTLAFDARGDERLGLVLASRQTLLTTYLFYQTLEYMGGSAGSWFAMLERGDASGLERVQALGRILGGIEVQVPDGAGGWTTVEEMSETGPLATDVKIVPLPASAGSADGPLRVRLRMTRGHIRLDWVALARIEERVTPVAIECEGVRRDAIADTAALAALRDPAVPLVTGPGDVYTLAYTLPADPADCDLFLESRGYYLEWMREGWVAREDPGRLAAMLLDPRGALRTLAPAYAREQETLEDWFWRSRFARP